MVAGVLVELLLPAGSPAGSAIAEAAGIGLMGAGLLFITAVGIVLHSAASSSD
jgi:hypothetical protein